MERLACSAAATYQPIEAAIHVSRYAGALALCPGKRVLDIACGEGYGAYLMAEAGAAAVLGIDVSAEAVKAAAANFPHPRLQLLAGDAAALDGLLGEAQFDLIVSLETVEHLGDPVGFLQALRRRCAPGGTIVVSCPNDHWYYAPAQQNPYHVRKYSFAEFRALAEECLGEGAWYFGTAALGFATLPIEGPAAGLTGLDHADARQARAAFLCRPGREDAVTLDRASYFLGAWGPDAPEVQGAALFPLSMDRYAAMLRTGDLSGHLATEAAARERLQAALATADAALRGQQQLAADQRAQAQREHAAQLAGAEAALARSTEALRQAEVRLDEAGRRAEQERRLARVQLHALRKENGILAASVARLQAAATEAQQQSAALLDAASQHAAALEAERDRSRQLTDALLDRQGAHDRLFAAHAALLEERAFLLAERERIFARMRPVWRVAQMIPSPMRRGMRRVAGPVLRRIAAQS
ncbi:methyltransferase domain-containing protein [Dankookia rubra]|uniref:Methyltransferase domain-containing protein n=1 Tax=Dankookia rubra TaxID=1442381 RepID=A0A4V3A9Y3_9PROT|nr:methyltransferase domain-containing protein [Dankookia rubra]TDH61045.1 methyltransferase domain-containing protein [Dankookia rubra]